MAVVANKREMTEALKTWPACNDFLRDAGEQDAEALLKLERGGKKRLNYLLRIHARFNCQRALRERAELAALTNG